MDKRKWIVYLLYCIPGISAAVWMEMLFGQSRPGWLVLAQAAIVGVPICIASYLCGRWKLKKTFWKGNGLNYLASWIGLALVDTPETLLLGSVFLSQFAPGNFYRQLLTLLFLVQLCFQWLANTLGQTMRERAENRAALCKKKSSPKAASD